MGNVGKLRCILALLSFVTPILALSCEAAPETPTIEIVPTTDVEATVRLAIERTTEASNDLEMAIVAAFTATQQAEMSSESTALAIAESTAANTPTPTVLPTPTTVLPTRVPKPTVPPTPVSTSTPTPISEEHKTATSVARVILQDDLRTAAAATRIVVNTATAVAEALQRESDATATAVILDAASTATAVTLDAEATATTEALNIQATATAVVEHAFATVTEENRRVDATATAVRSPSVRSSSTACLTRPDLAPAWSGGSGSKFTFDEDITKSGTSIGTSNYWTNLPNGWMEAEFLLVDERLSFGFLFRHHADSAVTVNNGYASDYIVVKKNGSVWEWRHHVRNKLTTSLSFNATLAAKGTLSNVITGPRGWNSMGVYFNGNEGGLVFNGAVIATLTLDPVIPNAYYSSQPIAGHYSNEPSIAQPVRNAVLLCP